MFVNELVELLEQCDQNAPVVIMPNYGNNDISSPLLAVNGVGDFTVNEYKFIHATGEVNHIHVKTPFVCIEYNGKINENYDTVTELIKKNNKFVNVCCG